MRLKLLVMLSIFCITLISYARSTKNSQDTSTPIPKYTLDALRSQSVVDFNDSGLHSYGICEQVDPTYSWYKQPSDGFHPYMPSPCILSLTDREILFYYWTLNSLNRKAFLFFHTQTDSIDTLFYTGASSATQQFQFLLNDGIQMIINLTEDDFQTPNIESREAILSLIRSNNVVLEETI